jgi:hypothetical protein
VENLQFCMNLSNTSLKDKETNIGVLCGVMPYCVVKELLMCHMIILPLPSFYKKGLFNLKVEVADSSK